MSAADELGDAAMTVAEMDRLLPVIAAAVECTIRRALTDAEAEHLHGCLVIAWCWPPGLTFGEAVPAGMAVALPDGSYLV